MSILTPTRWIAAATMSLLLAIGCSRDSGSPSAVAKRGEQPRRIQVPADIRPIQIQQPKSDDLAEGNPVRAQYQQPHAVASGPRIVELSRSGETSGNSPIRPPSATNVSESAAPAPPPQRSE